MTRDIQNKTTQRAQDTERMGKTMEGIEKRVHDLETAKDENAMENKEERAAGAAALIK